MNIREHSNLSLSATAPIKVAVTGGAGSGKTAVCNRFKELGVRVISSDVLARQAVAPSSAAYGEIVEYFGDKVLAQDGALNRPMLRRIILKDEGARRALERFIHPEIIRLMQAQMAEAEKEAERVVLAEVPLLFELGLQDQFDVVVLVSADHELKVKRLMARDHVSRNDAEALLQAQRPDEEKAPRSDFIIKNNGSMAQMIKSVDVLCKKFYREYQKKQEKA